MITIFDDFLKLCESYWWILLLAVLFVGIVLFWVAMPTFCLIREGRGKSVTGWFWSKIKRWAMRRSDKVIRKCGVSVDDAEAAVLLAEKENQDILRGRKIKRMYDFFSKKTLNACAGDDGVSIFVSASWYATLLNADERTKAAFRATLGHEVGHQSGQLPEKSFWYDFFHFREYVFRRQTGEVHADFYGVFYGLSGSVAAGIDAMKFKRSRVLFFITDFYHPSWKKRMKYISYGKFDEELIRQIAKDVGFKKKKKIDEVVDYYRKDENLKLK